MRVLAIDLGGTNMRAGLVDGDALEPSPVGHWKAPATLEEFRDRVETLLREHEATKLGVAIPGLARGTVSTWVPNLPYLDGVDFAALFPDVHLTLGNDAHFSLLAEAAGGAASQAENAILLAIGTGIGSAVLADGRVVRGQGGAATSFGWACADPSDGGHPAHGWLERMASGTALDRLAARHGLPDGAALVSRARSGDGNARTALEAPMTALGTTLAGAVALTGASLVIFTGGVADSFEVLEPLLRPALTRHLPPHLRDVRLAPGHFGPRAALTGAGLAARGHPIWRGNP
ncbi:ROK family protein [Chelativorans sp. SCAU2101]|uniref:ROK family protein n=1 Tax=Chelativorans petroleitrophicus TaxID=2975484 RepID=A0A9X2XAJ5_9HYPH|nr:ROK family protein [Chelativorans petroleitrophicus]MCT8991106.1 ROK family protein [Chelativorans petroleitrophicus]